MNIKTMSFWYGFYRYMHRSWFERINIPLLSPTSSELRFRVAYGEVCSQLEIDQYSPNVEMNAWIEFIARFVLQPTRYLRTAGICLSTRPKAEFFDAALMTEKELNFAKKMCKAMSLNQRFVCADQFQLSSYEAGTMLMHAHVLGTCSSMWQRVQLSLDATVVGELDEPEGAMNLHQPALKRLWKMVDSFIQDSETEVTDVST